MAAEKNIEKNQGIIAFREAIIFYLKIAWAEDFVDDCNLYANKLYPEQRHGPGRKLQEDQGLDLRKAFISFSLLPVQTKTIDNPNAAVFTALA